NAELCRRCDRCRPAGPRAGAARGGEESAVIGVNDLLTKSEPESPDPEKIDNAERLVRLGYFVAVVLVLAIVTGFSPFLGVIFALVSFSMLHDFGHFINAKCVVMIVTEYFFGFGPRRCAIKRGETEYGIKAIAVAVCDP